ncbi:hypothetical protein CBEIJ_40280 [Clostridium beijerinckii]|nr:hypothetical protein CBEIJ_40280 [Clostridium beijerinckii]
MILIFKYLDILLFLVFFCISLIFMINYIQSYHRLVGDKKANLVIDSHLCSNKHSYFMYIFIIFLIIRNIAESFSLYLLLSNCILIFIIILCLFLYDKVVSKMYFLEDGIFIGNKFIEYIDIRSLDFIEEKNEVFIVKIYYTFLEKVFTVSYKISLDSKSKIEDYINSLNFNINFNGK